MRSAAPQDPAPASGSLALQAPRSAGRDARATSPAPAGFQSAVRPSLALCATSQQAKRGAGVVAPLLAHWLVLLGLSMDVLLGELLAFSSAEQDGEMAPRRSSDWSVCCRHARRQDVALTWLLPDSQPSQLLLHKLPCDRPTRRVARHPVVAPHASPLPHHPVKNTCWSHFMKRTTRYNLPEQPTHFYIPLGPIIK
jgi:hypothetical protein